jgi:hypothetical protein
MSITTSAPVRVNAILAAIREHSEAFEDDEPGPDDREWLAAQHRYGDEDGPDLLLAHTVSAFDFHAEICAALDRLERGHPLC